MNERLQKRDNSRYFKEDVYSRRKVSKADIFRIKMQSADNNEETGKIRDSNKRAQGVCGMAMETSISQAKRLFGKRRKKIQGESNNKDRQKGIQNDLCSQEGMGKGTYLPMGIEVRISSPRDDFASQGFRQIEQFLRQFDVDEQNRASQITLRQKDNRQIWQISSKELNNTEYIEVK
jgi:hypothetical protein